MKKIENSLLDPFVKWFFPKLLPFVPRWMSANLISVIGLLLAVAAGGTMIYSDSVTDPVAAKWVYMLGGGLFFLTWVTDTMDGIVARARRQTSWLGYYMDHYFDAITTAVIGMSLFIANGSHYQIGLMLTGVYMLFMINGHIKVKLLDTLTLPVFGPTEVRFLIIAVMFGQTQVHFREPLNWLPELTGKEGAIIRFFHMDPMNGLSFMDLLGLVVLAAGIIGLFVELFLTMRQLHRLDRKNAEKGGADE